MGKFCGKCGKEIEKGVKFCPNCGNANEEVKEEVKAEVVSNETTEGNPTNGMAIAGFIVSFFVPVLGLIFSIIGLNKANQLNGSGKGFAKAGLILSIVWIVLEIVAVIIYYLFIAAALVGASYYY